MEKGFGGGWEGVRSLRRWVWTSERVVVTGASCSAVIPENLKSWLGTEISRVLAKKAYRVR